MKLQLSKMVMATSLIIFDRFEGKHKENKNYTKNTNSRLQISFSIGKKVQYKFANRLLQKRGLDDEISVFNRTIESLEKKVILRSTLCIL